jgi:hypothetical protein
VISLARPVTAGRIELLDYRLACSPFAFFTRRSAFFLSLLVLLGEFRGQGAMHKNLEIGLITSAISLMLLPSVRRFRMRSGSNLSFRPVSVHD